MQNQAMHIKAVVFHLENTLVQPNGLDIDGTKISNGLKLIRNTGGNYEDQNRINNRE